LNYVIALERADLNYDEFEPLYQQHYKEMQDRLRSVGIEKPDYKPRLEQYFNACRGGWLLHYTVRYEGKPVGYSNVYLMQDMHNSEFVAKEDTVYVLPEHRNGIGRKLVKHILDDLRDRGVKSVTISPVTDLRVGKIWKRMGFKPVAELMTYTF